MGGPGSGRKKGSGKAVKANALHELKNAINRGARNANAGFNSGTKRELGMENRHDMARAKATLKTGKVYK